MSKKISEKVYTNKTKDGERILIHYNDYKLTDGVVASKDENNRVTEEHRNYFMKDFSGNETGIYQLTLEESYNILSNYVADSLSDTMFMDIVAKSEA
jgi:hypothetical protein